MTEYERRFDDCARDAALFTAAVEVAAHLVAGWALGYAAHAVYGALRLAGWWPR